LVSQIQQFQLKVHLTLPLMDYLNGLVGNETASAFVYGPEGSTAGQVKYTGTAFLTSYEVSGGVGDIVGYTAEFQVTGAITRGTYA